MFLFINIKKIIRDRLILRIQSDNINSDEYSLLLENI